MAKRPWRTDFFAVIARDVGAAAPAGAVLELGAGPGFLAGYLLDALPAISYVWLDFSPAMHALARQRLGPSTARAKFIERSFKDVDWEQGLGTFDSVVTMQAVHELRHKRHAVALHRAVRRVISPGGPYLVCDHFAGDGGMVNHDLYMTIDEQSDCLRTAGFERIEVVLQRGGLVLHRAR